LKTEESELPYDYAPASYTLSRSYGGLKLATDVMLKTFSEVESVIEDFFQNENHIYVRDCFEDVISKVSELNLLSICCDDHEDVLPFLIMEYVQIRFHFESTRYRNNFFASYNSQVHTNKKIAKNV
jgi:hypothetical protein